MFEHLLQVLPFCRCGRSGLHIPVLSVNEIQLTETQVTIPLAMEPSDIFEAKNLFNHGFI